MLLNDTYLIVIPVSYTFVINLKVIHQFFFWNEVDKNVLPSINLYVAEKPFLVTLMSLLNMTSMFVVEMISSGSVLPQYLRYKDKIKDDTQKI